MKRDPKPWDEMTPKERAATAEASEHEDADKLESIPDEVTNRKEISDEELNRLFDEANLEGHSDGLEAERATASAQDGEGNPPREEEAPPHALKGPGL